MYERQAAASSGSDSCMRDPGRCERRCRERSAEANGVLQQLDAVKTQLNNMQQEKKQEEAKAKAEPSGGPFAVPGWLRVMRHRH